MKLSRKKKIKTKQMLNILNNISREITTTKVEAQLITGSFCLGTFAINKLLCKINVFKLICLINWWQFSDLLLFTIASFFFILMRGGHPVLYINCRFDFITYESLMYIFQFICLEICNRYFFFSENRGHPISTVTFI